MSRALTRALTISFVIAATMAGGCAPTYTPTTKPVRNLTLAEMTEYTSFHKAFYAEWGRRHPNPGMDPEHFDVMMGVHDVDYVPHPPFRVEVRIARYGDLADVMSAIVTAYESSKVNDIDLVIRRVETDSKIIARLELSRTPGQTRPRSWYDTAGVW